MADIKLNKNVSLLGRTFDLEQGRYPIARDNLFHLLHDIQEHYKLREELTGRHITSVDYLDDLIRLNGEACKIEGSMIYVRPCVIGVISPTSEINLNLTIRAVKDLVYAHSLLHTIGERYGKPISVLGTKDTCLSEKINLDSIENFIRENSDIPESASKISSKLKQVRLENIRDLQNLCSASKYFQQKEIAILRRYLKSKEID